jgi:transcriptional regulator with XRE-family HTH domain
MNLDLLDTMKNEDIRKAFGARLKTLRKQKKLTQKELAEKIDVRHPQLNKYECGLHTPPLIVLVLMAEVLDTTVDYLLTGDRIEAGTLHNFRLQESFKALEEFDKSDQEAVIKLIDAMIVKQKMEGALQVAM